MSEQPMTEDEVAMEHPLRWQPDGSPCWCVSTEAPHEGWIHSPVCNGRTRAYLVVRARRGGVLLGVLTPAGMARSGELAERMDEAPLEDVIRILVAAAHALWHRAPERMSHENLARELRQGIDDIHELGLP